ncbi:hypothetical protein M569_08855 [Genlisea aurea]|uniref:BZIP domain-containing protein n=1 Tax=Genlisea aurea TaxID=192259 RepID=S8CG81_9LAMI|nr:hypothetical protein M569_08855 [Genlisea aurea]
MDNEDLDNQVLSYLDAHNAQSSCSFDIDEYFLDRTQSCNDAVGRTEAYTDVLGRTQACTHAHACNPSGPDKSHTHTCIHVHTQIMASPSDDTAESIDKNKSKKRPLGNREAVRKYREKKKARAASLEDEVIKLRAINQQLMKRVQSQSLLEAEVARLKCLLVDIRGRIEGEIGSFPYQQKPVKDVAEVAAGGYVIGSAAGQGAASSYMVVNPCNVQSNCLGHGSENAPDGEACRFEKVHCYGNHQS